VCQTILQCSSRRGTSTTSGRVWNVRKPKKTATRGTGSGDRQCRERAPILVAGAHKIDFTCGHCGVVLMHGEDEQVHGLLIRCTACGSYNLTV
jgi:hypothetical protein